MHGTNWEITSRSAGLLRKRPYLTCQRNWHFTSVNYEAEILHAEHGSAKENTSTHLKVNTSNKFFIQLHPFLTIGAYSSHNSVIFAKESVGSNST